MVEARIISDHAATATKSDSTPTCTGASIRIPVDCATDLYYTSISTKGMQGSDIHTLYTPPPLSLPTAPHRRQTKRKLRRVDWRRRLSTAGQPQRQFKHDNCCIRAGPSAAARNYTRY